MFNLNCRQSHIAALKRPFPFINFWTMRPDRSNPKRRRLESSESGGSTNIGYASHYNGNWSYYPESTTAVAAPITNSFASPSHPPDTSPWSVSSLYSQSTAPTAPIPSLFTGPLTALPSEQLVWPQTAAITPSTTTCLPVPGALPISLSPFSDSQFYWPLITSNTQSPILIPDPLATSLSDSPFHAQATAIAPATTHLPDREVFATLPSPLGPPSQSQSMCDASTPGCHPSSESSHDVPVQGSTEVVCFGEVGLSAKFSPMLLNEKKSMPSHLRGSEHRASTFCNSGTDKEL